ncbi:MAG TPA: hypothetical protein VG146_10415 [Verrucomicrobiae bacterium]|nr:hypothetical protein [Verrucomicrobiae bacterium]
MSGIDVGFKLGRGMVPLLGDFDRSAAPRFMKIDTLTIVMAASILLVGCGKQSGSPGAASAPESEQSSTESAATVTNLAGTWKLVHSKTNAPLHIAPYTLTLTMAGGTLTGTVSNVSTVNGKSRVYKWPIKNAKLQGSELSFSVTHPFEVGRGEVASSYNGNVTSNIITGTIEESFLGQTHKGFWTAERVTQ